MQEVEALEILDGAMLGVTPNTVDRWIRDKRISAIRLLGGKYRISEEEFARIKTEGRIDKE